jgi:hypothetical protein
MLRVPMSLFALALLLVVAPPPRPADARDPCLHRSTQIFDHTQTPPVATGVTLIDGSECGTYATVTTRYQHDPAAAGGETPVTVPYMINEPPTGTATQGIVVLLPGGSGSAALVACTGDATQVPQCQPPGVYSASTNFLVRSAQLFAEQGFLTLTMDLPHPRPSADSIDVDRAAHGADPLYYEYKGAQTLALDIAGVVGQVRGTDQSLPVFSLPVFLAGTSNGTLAAVGQNALGMAIMLSSPITVQDPDVPPVPDPYCVPNSTTSFPFPCKPYLNDGVEAYFQASWVHVPVQILEHANDPCRVSPPSGAHDFYQALTGVKKFFHEMHRGFLGPITDATTPGESAADWLCDAESFHGYAGIEPKTVDRITARMTAILDDINTTHPHHNAQPLAGDADLAANSTATGSLVPLVDLATVATDPFGGTLTFTLPHPNSARGAHLSFSSTGVVAYDATGFTRGSADATVHDAFVYAASNGKGKRSFGVISVTVTVPKSP